MAIIAICWWVRATAQEGAKLISEKLQQPADTGQPVLLSSKAQSSILASLMGQSQNSNPDTLVIYVFSGQSCVAERGGMRNGTV